VTTEEIAPHIHAMQSIYINVSDAKTTLDRLIVGDKHARIEDVRYKLSESRQLTKAMLFGDDIDNWHYVPESSEVFRENIEALDLAMEDFASAANSRYARRTKNRKTIGSLADQKFDFNYRNLLSELEKLAGDSSDKVIVNELRFRLAQSHLILEEILGGDIGEEYREVTENFEQSKNLLLKLQTRDKAPLELMDHLEILIDLADNRYNRNLQVKEKITLLARSKEAYERSFVDFLMRAETADKNLNIKLIQARENLASSERRPRQVFILLITFSLLMSVLIVWRISRSVLLPTKLMIQEINRVSDSEDASLRLSQQGSDELGQIAAAFNRFLALRVHMDKELLEARKYIDGITDAAPQLLYYVDKDYIYRFANKAFEKWYGESLSLFINNPVKFSYSEESYMAVLPYMRSALSGEFCSYEMEIHDRHGQSFYVSATYTPEYSSDGEVMGFFASVEDLSLAKSAEKELKGLNESFRLATDSLGIGVWEYRPLENTLIWDEWMFKLYDKDPKEFRGLTDDWIDSIHPDDVTDTSNQLAAAMSGGEKFDTEFRIITPSNETRSLKGTATVLYDELGDPERMIGINYDITERKVFENELIRTKEAAEQGAEVKERARNIIPIPIDYDLK
jgi:PAS domain S-box-containing protein